jgi:hypothetical protein
MSMINSDPLSATPGRVQRGNGHGGSVEGGDSTTAEVPGQPSHARVTGADRDPSPHGMARLDEPYLAVGAMPRGDAAPCTVAARAGQEVIDVASVSRQLPPGPPLRGVYRIHDVAARTTGRRPGDGTGVIALCIAHAAAHGGRTLWCHATRSPPSTSGAGMASPWPVRPSPWGAAAGYS